MKYLPKPTKRNLAISWRASPRGPKANASPQNASSPIYPLDEIVGHPLIDPDEDDVSRLILETLDAEASLSRASPSANSASTFSTTPPPKRT